MSEIDERLVEAAAWVINRPAMSLKPEHYGMTTLPGLAAAQQQIAKDKARAVLALAYEAAKPAPAEPSCDEQLAEAERLASNIGYMVVPDPVHGDGEVHAPEFVMAMQPSLRALGFHAVPIAKPAPSPSGGMVEQIAKLLWASDNPPDQEYSLAAPCDWEKWPDTPRHASLAGEHHSREDYRRLARVVADLVSQQAGELERVKEHATRMEVDGGKQQHRADMANARALAAEAALATAIQTGLNAAAQYLEACDDPGDRSKAADIRQIKVIP